MMTRATGFIGRALLHEPCDASNDSVIALSRRTIEDAPANSRVLISEGFSVPEVHLPLFDTVESYIEKARV